MWTALNEGPRLAATWDGWRLESEPQQSQANPLDHLALSDTEAARTVETVITKARTAVTVVSKADVRERYHRWVRDVVADKVTEPKVDNERDTDQSVFAGLETEVALLWREVLGIAPAGPDESFFAVGGHSLMGLRLVSRIKDRFNVPFEYAILVENDTVGKAARWIAAQGACQPHGPRTANRPSRTLSELLRLVKETMP